LSVFPLLVVLFAADSCSGKNGADVVPQDAEVTPPTPDDMDSSVSPETPPPTDVTDTEDNVELVVDLQELGKVDLDAPGPEGKVVPPPNLFPYKLAATYVLQHEGEAITTPWNVAVGANGSLLCVAGHFPDAPRTVLCYQVGLPGEELEPVDTTNLDEALASLKQSEVVGMAIPAGKDRLYLTLEGGGTGNHLALAEYDPLTNSFIKATTSELYTLDNQIKLKFTPIYHPETTTDGAYIYSSSDRLGTLSISNDPTVISAQQLTFNEAYGPLQVMLNSTESWVVAGWLASSCAGHWWVFERDQGDGSLSLLTQQLVMGNCSITCDDAGGSVIGAAPDADRFLFAGSTLVGDVALGLASIQPGAKDAISLVADLLPEFAPRSTSMSTLPSVGLAAQYIGHYDKAQAGLAIVQIQPQATQAEHVQFIPEPDFDQELSLLCGDCTNGCTRLQAFSPGGTRLFLACETMWDPASEGEENPGRLFVFESEGNN